MLDAMPSRTCRHGSKSMVRPILGGAGSGYQPICPSTPLFVLMEPFRRILIPTDGSDNAKVAVAKGLELAKMTVAEVTAISVMDSVGLAYAAQSTTMSPIYQLLKDGADSAVGQVRKEGEKLGVPVRTVVKEGNPADEIAKASGNYDLIVMGTLGRTGLAHLLLGSVAEKVVRFASCPVMVVRVPKKTGSE